MEKYGYRFSFGPWNIHEGADPFGPAVRPSLTFAQKLPLYVELGFDAVQFHDDDAVPELNDLSPMQIRERARAVRRQLEEHGLVAEFVAPRLWEHPMTIDGAYTSNDAKARAYAIERSKRAADIAQELGCDLMVLWLAREGILHARVQGCRPGGTPVAGSDQYAAGLRQSVAHRHRAETQRADGSRLHPDHGPCPGPGPPLG